MNAVRELGVEEQDIQLEGLQLTPRRVYDPDRRVYDQDGFEALRTVEITVRDLELLPDLIAAVVEEGANQINRIQYGLDDRSSIELEVLARAVQRAAEKASVMAAQVGRSIGQALQMSEQEISVPQSRMRVDATEMVAMAKDEGGNPDAFSAGDIEVRATVSILFSLVDSQE